MKKINNDLGGLVALTLFLSAIFYPTSVHASLFGYKFSTDGILKESGSMQESSSPYWWLNSGGRMFINNSRGETIQGEVSSNFWKNAYEKANPEDTDDGSHPQNIFRLLTKTKWANTRQEVYFQINKINVSLSPNRNESNGILLMSRFLNVDNFYYAGVRVDGHAVIKKKKNGVYYTMAEEKFFESDASYGVNTNPNLIPGARWIGIRVDTHNDNAEGVSISLFVDKTSDGSWQRVLSAHDNGNIYGGDAILEPGLMGIRTDFIDASFDDYKIIQIP